MTRPKTSQLTRLLRADVKTIADDDFVVTLADVARNAPATPMRRVPLAAKVGAAAAAVAVTMFGAAYASDLFVPPPPTQLDPTQPVTDEPTGDERENRDPVRPADHRRSPAGGTRQDETREDSGAEVDTPDSLGPAATEDEPPEASTEEPLPAGDPGPVGDESGDEPDSEPDSDSGDPEDDPEDDAGDDSQDSSEEDSEAGSEGSPEEDGPDEDSGAPEQQDDADESSPDD